MLKPGFTYRWRRSRYGLTVTFAAFALSWWWSRLLYVKTGHAGVSAFSQIVSRVGLQSGESLRSDVYDRIAGSPHACTIPLNWIDAKTKMRRNNTKTMSLFCGKVTAVFSFHFARVSTTRKKKGGFMLCPTYSSLGNNDFSLHEKREGHRKLF